jgi:hypothetical protein
VNNQTGQVTVYATIPPPATAYPAAEESVRVAVNQFIFSQNGGNYLDGNADGVIDFAAAVSNTGTDAGTIVNPLYESTDTANPSGPPVPSNAYYRALTQQFFGSTDPATGSVLIPPNTVRSATIPIPSVR